ncbi:MAG TPA: hypothetical protein VNH14_10135 [Gemmatimonadales bacterium]|nr:hypothetical protein [Gemmatimonadales bacterium]
MTRGLHLAPGDGLAPIGRLAPLALTPPLLLDRDEVETALADATLQVGAAVR